MSSLFRTLALRTLAACSVLFVLPFQSDLTLAAIMAIFFGALCLLGVKYSRDFSVLLSLTVFVSVLISNFWHYCWLMMGWWGGFGYLPKLLDTDGASSYDWRLAEMFLTSVALTGLNLIFLHNRRMQQSRTEQISDTNSLPVPSRNL